MATYPKNGRRSASVLPASPPGVTPADSSTNPKRFVQPESYGTNTPLVAQDGPGWPQVDSVNASKKGGSLPDDGLITGVVQSDSPPIPATTDVTPSAVRFGVTNP